MKNIVKLLVFCYLNVVGLISPTLMAHINKVQASEVQITIAQNNSKLPKLNYDQYMKAGYESAHRRNYQEALGNFQEALKLRPRNSYAQKAFFNVKSYIYNDYMQQGYKANKQRDYETALKYFKQAANERPNDVYAQQAISNVQTFAQEQNSINNSTQTSQNAPNSLLLILIIFMGIVAMGLGLIIIRLFQSKSEIKEIKNLPENSEFSTADSTIINELIDSEITPNSSNSNSPENSNNNSSEIKESNLVALQQTSNINPVDNMPQLLLDLKHDNPKKRRKAIWDLAQKGDSRAVKPLVQIMINADSYEKSLILEALSQISTNSMKPLNQALLISLQDENPQVRKNAIRDLSKIYELINQIQPLISHAALHDSDPEVREIATWALNKLNSNKNIPQLESSNKNEEVNVTLISDESE